MNVLTAPRDHAAVRSGYVRDGYASVQGLLSREVATALLARMKGDLAREGVDLNRIAQHGPLLIRPAMELYGHHYPMFSAFHWGLTPAIVELRRILHEDMQAHDRGQE